MSKGWRCRVNYNVNPFVGASGHHSVTPIGLPAYLCHIEFGVVQGLWFGSFLSNGRHKKLVSDHLLFLGRGSDAGICIPHISIPPSWMNILTSLFASSNALFGSSEVAMACRNMIWGNQDCDMGCTPFGKVPFSINLCCFDPISLPTDVVVLWSSIYVGMTWGDIVAAAIDFAIAVACDLISMGIGELLSYAGKKIMSAISDCGSDVGEGIMTRAAKRMREKFAVWSGDAASAGMKDYIAKAAKAEALAGVADMTDAELKTFVKESSSGVFSEGFEDVVEKLGLSVRDCIDEFPAESILKQEAEATTKELVEDLSETLTEQGIKDTVRVNELRDALIELDKVVVARRSSAALLDGGKKALKSTLSKVVWRAIKYGNFLGDGTEGGLLSTSGLGLTNILKPTFRHADMGYADALDLDDLGLTSDEDATDIDNAYVSDGKMAYSTEGSDDYWYTTKIGSSDDDDYDYTSSTTGS